MDNYNNACELNNIMILLFRKKDNTMEVAGKSILDPQEQKPSRSSGFGGFAKKKSKFLPFSFYFCFGKHVVMSIQTLKREEDRRVRSILDIKNGALHSRERDLFVGNLLQITSIWPETETLIFLI